MYWTQAKMLLLADVDEYSFANAEMPTGLMDSYNVLELSGNSHYPNQCWPRSKSPHGVIWPQSIKTFQMIFYTQDFSA